MALQPGLCILALLDAPGADEQFRVSLGLGCLFVGCGEFVEILLHLLCDLAAVAIDKASDRPIVFRQSHPCLLCKRIGKRVFCIADLDEFERLSRSETPYDDRVRDILAFEVKRTVFSAAVRR
jgi:hypothetical protein